jgi:hydroxypyruvate reductase
MLRRWKVKLFPAIKGALESPSGETPKPGDGAFDKAEFRIVARPKDSLQAAATLGRAAGYSVVNLGDALEGEAAEVGAEHGRMAVDAVQQGRRIIFLSGGELTVTLRGDGEGGPNQEYALALARAIDGNPGITALAADTDGTDGGSGASTDPAGAFVDSTTLARGQALGLNAANFLKNNDSLRFFGRIGDLLVTGPTGTNVNDFRCVVVDKPNFDGP